MKKCLKIKVLGKVQDVLYRQFVRKNAEKLSLAGTVQNDFDGSVLIFVCGMSEKLDDLIDMLYKGSAKSKVENVVFVISTSVYENKNITVSETDCG